MGAHEIQEKLRGIGQALGDLHDRIHAVGQEIEKAEQEASDSGLPRVVASMRDAYVNLAEAGRALVEAHLNLNIPPGAWKGEPAKDTAPAAALGGEAPPRAGPDEPARGEPPVEGRAPGEGEPEDPVEGQAPAEGEPEASHGGSRQERDEPGSA